MSSPRNIFIFDLETSGLRPEEGAEIVQIACYAMQYWNFEPHHAGTFEIVLKPNHPEKASQAALDVIGLDLWNRALKEGIDQKTGLARCLEWIRNLNDSKKDFNKPLMAGHNVIFDYNFLAYWLKHYKLITHTGEAPYQEKIIDTWTLSWLLFENDSGVTNISLDNMLGLINVQRKGQLHDAVEDVTLNGELLKRYMKFYRECRKRLEIKARGKN
jgi:DNA polymerase III alpha subunit (gram-positive type)